MSTILVTGGSGYIGSHTIVQLLRNTPYQVLSIDNNIKSKTDTMHRIEQITGVRVQNHSIDLCNLDATRAVFERTPNILGLIHFAALKSVPESVEKPLWYYQNNINALANVLELCTTFNIPNFIFSSSCSVYGEGAALPVQEQTPLNQPVSPYAHTKQIGEAMIRSFLKTQELKAVSLRYFNPVGADYTGLIGENPIDPPTSLVPVITETAFGTRPQMTVYGTDYDTRDGSCIRDYIHVTDIADAHIAALNFLADQQPTGDMEVFNLGSGEGISVLEAIHAFEKVTGKKLNYKLGPRRPGDVAEIYSNSGKAKKNLGWTPKYGIDEMMASAWKWEKLRNLS